MDQPTVSPNATEPTESAEPNLAQAQMTVLAAWINRSGDPGDVQHLTAQHFPNPYARAYWATILDNAACARNENTEETLERARGSFPMARDGWQELWSHMLDAAESASRKEMQDAAAQLIGHWERQRKAELDRRLENFKLPALKPQPTPQEAEVAEFYARELAGRGL